MVSTFVPELYEVNDLKKRGKIASPQSKIFEKY